MYAVDSSGVWRRCVCASVCVCWVERRKRQAQASSNGIQSGTEECVSACMRFEGKDEMEDCVANQPGREPLMVVWMRNATGWKTRGRQFCHMAEIQWENILNVLHCFFWCDYLNKCIGAIAVAGEPSDFDTNENKCNSEIFYMKFPINELMLINRGQPKEDEIINYFCVGIEKGCQNDLGWY